MNDFRYALRQLAARPGFTAAAVTTLALGLGATTAIATLADKTLLRPPGLRDADRLAVLFTSCRRGDPRCSSSYPDYVDYRDRSTAFADMAAYSWVPLSVETAAGARSVVGQVVTGNYFSVLGVPLPAAGRFLQPADDARGAPPVVVISYEAWQSDFGGTEDVVGRTVRVNDVPFTLVGVAPRGFRGLDLGGDPDAWLPMAAGPLLGDAVGAVGDPETFEARGTRWIHALVGRLAPNLTVDGARAEMNAVSAALQRDDPEAREGRSITIDPLSRYVLPIGQEQAFVRFVGLLSGVVALTLLLATANLANLLLARAIGRRREMGIRLAAGASGFRIARQLIVESVTLAALGGIVGLGVGGWALDLLGGFALPGDVTIGDIDLRLDGRMLGIVAALTVITGCAFGLAPALRAASTDVMGLLRGAARPGGERAHLRWALVSVQVALCLVLLVGAGLFLRTLKRALDVDLGFRQSGVALVRFNPALARLSEERAAHLVRRVLEEAEALPGVEAAAVATLVPLQDGGHQGTFVTVDGYEPAPDEEMRVEYVFASDAFFEALGIPMRRGSGWRGERAGGRAVVINETMARRYWADRDPIEGHVRIGESTVFDVVGVAGDVTWRTVLDDATSFVFIPLEESPSVMASGFLTLAVRTSNRAGDVLPALQDVFRSLAPDVPVTDVATMDGQVTRVLMPQRFGAFLLTLLGLLAVVLAVVGIYGVVAFTVNSETRNIGVRLALGATGRDVVISITRRTAVPVVTGLGAGILLALVLTQPVAPFLVGMGPTDALTFVVVTGTLLLAALVAAWVPARRASRVEPMEALRQE